MKILIKKLFPRIVSLSRPFRLLILNFTGYLRFSYFLFFRDFRHKSAILKIKEKLFAQKQIKVAFIVFDPAVWKYEGLYRLFDSDDRFLPSIVIAVRNGQDPQESFKKTLDFFAQKHDVIGGSESGIEFHKAFKKNFKPDIVVTSAPYDYFHKNFKSYNLTRYLTIYAQYGINLSYIKFMEINPHNNLLWRCYVESNFHFDLYNSWIKELGRTKYNFRISGYIGVEYIQRNNYESNDFIIKPRKLVIWAPHWSIDKSNETHNIATFLYYYNLIDDLADKYKGEIDFALKPHPLLREILSREYIWGLNSTNDYFDKWEKGLNTSLVQGNYVDLFNQSDAIIHDSHAFTVEYLYTCKPAAYLINDSFDLNYYNDYGKEALKCYQFIKNKKDIVNFLDNLISGKDPKLKKRQEFYNQYLRDHHHTASENVYNDILNSILDDK